MNRSTPKKMLEVARQLVAQRDEYRRTGNAVLRRQTEEELRQLLPRNLWRVYGV